MRNILSSLLLFSLSLVYSQVALGKTSISNSSVSLEFGTQNRGLILPWVTTAASVVNAVDGTFIFDSDDKKVKFRKAGTWFDLSIDDKGVVDTSLQNSLTEDLDAQLAIGADASKNSVPGVLVLTDRNKAMVLPLVASPHLNIIDPAPGTMVYDTENKQLAVFNGTVWTFWKP